MSTDSAPGKDWSRWNGSVTTHGWDGLGSASRFLDTVTDHGIGTAGLVGRSARVVQAVTETDGRVKLGGDTWSARIPQGGRVCEPGEEVRVISISGATAIVSGESAQLTT